MLQGSIMDNIKKRAIDKRRAEFDAIWMFKIAGTGKRFE